MLYSASILDRVLIDILQRYQVAKIAFANDYRILYQEHFFQQG